MGNTASVTISISESGKKSPTYRLETDLSGEVSLSGLLKFTKAALVQITTDVFYEEKARGFDPEPIVVTDGIVGKLPSNVHPLGSITLISRKTVLNILTPIYDEIIKRSRVETGLYKENNIVTVNGAQVAANPSELRAYLAGHNLNNGVNVRFINTTPYARSLELSGQSQGKSKSVTNAKFAVGRKNKRGKRSGTAIVRIPNGTYVKAFRAIKRLYGNNAKIEFTFEPGPSLGRVTLPRTDKRGKKLRTHFSEKRKHGGGRPYLYPTILVVIQGDRTLKDILQ